jgi:hypothetical protein
MCKWRNLNCRIKIDRNTSATSYNLHATHVQLELFVVARHVQLKDIKVATYMQLEKY